MTSQSDPGRGVSRRRFLGSAGAGAGAFAVGLPGRFDGSPAANGSSAPVRFSRNLVAGKFGRMFPDLPSFAEPSVELTEAILELTRPGGILDANDPLEVGPLLLLTDPDLSPDNPDNPTQPKGITFMGQFLDHDITRDGGSDLNKPKPLANSTNLRTPRFDLDSVYGSGPLFSPQLYTRKPVKFKVGSGGVFEDLPRMTSGKAIIADPRNDENMFTAGIHAAMLLFHNAIADQMATTRKGDYWFQFEEVRRQVVWHWQWIIWNEYLPLIVSPDVLADIRANGPRFFTERRPRIPVEFQGAAFRFGHSQVRPSYFANFTGDGGNPFIAMVFDVDEPDSADPNSFVGGKRGARRFVDWGSFFDFGDGEWKPNKKIDTKISTPMFRIPTGIIDLPRGGEVGPTSIATRNLMRHVTWEIPSGQAIAERIGAPRLAPGDLADLEPFGANLAASTPLWFYVLKEAELMENGERLGPVGGRIVGEVFHNLLEQDPTSFRTNPDWRPTLPSRLGPGQFCMADLLTVAGVAPRTKAS